MEWASKLPPDHLVIRIFMYTSQFVLVREVQWTLDYPDPFGQSTCSRKTMPDK